MGWERLSFLYWERLSFLYLITGAQLYVLGLNFFCCFW